MDHYSTLGVESSATLEEIKAAYRQAALKHHPDKNPGDPEAESRFKAVGVAYDVLSNGLKRSEYDRKRPKPKAPVWQPPPKDPVQIVEGTFFGGGTSGRNILVHLKVPKTVMKEGGRRNIHLSKNGPCPKCQGDGTIRSLCKSCGGFRPNDATGHNHSVTWCRFCEGDGYLYVKCLKCEGNGTGSAIVAIVRVIIPPSSVTGNSVIVHGEGEAAAGKAPGYLKVVLIEE
jgi:molecular chaperone DnaJ